MTYGTMWLIISGICLLLEIFTVSFLLFFPGVGAFLTFISYLLGANIYLQVSIFVVTSALMILFIRPIITKFFKAKDTPMNSNSLIGKKGVILKEISSGKIGQVKVAGEIWSAIAKDNSKIEEDSEVSITAIDGVKLIVERI